MSNLIGASDRFGKSTTKLEEVETPEPQHGGGGGGGGRTLNERIATLEANMTGLATKADIEAVRGDFHKTNSEMKNWLITTIIALMFGFGALYVGLTNTVRTGIESIGAQQRATQQPTPAQPQPIIIQLPAQPPPPTPAPSPAE